MDRKALEELVRHPEHDELKLLCNLTKENMMNESMCDAVQKIKPDPGKMEVISDHIDQLNVRVTGMFEQVGDKADSIFGSNGLLGSDESGDPIADGYINLITQQLSRLEASIEDLQSEIDRFSDL